MTNIFIYSKAAEQHFLHQQKSPLVMFGERQSLYTATVFYVQVTVLLDSQLVLRVLVFLLGLSELSKRDKCLQGETGTQANGAIFMNLE